ncbi:MAG: hypothetical protein U0Q16_34580 [Bryobacteraceae bacterium]
MRTWGFLLTLAVSSSLLFARGTGAPAGSAGVDGEGSCLACHRGVKLNAGGGGVAVAFPGSLTYTPGVTQRLRITVVDSSGGAMGYQLTARRADNPAVPAGGFTVPAAVAGGFGPGGGGFPPGGGGGTPGVIVARSRVICWNGDLENEGNPKPATGCPSDAPIESVTHAQDMQPSTSGTVTWEIDFVPPDSAVGPIQIYAAGNAVRGPEERNSRVYTNLYTLEARDPEKPTINSISLDNGFGTGTVFSPGTWLQLSGFSLAATIRSSNTVDFTNNTAPTSMDSVRVKIGGKNAFLSFVSDDSVRALVPADVSAGSVPMTVSVGPTVSAESKIQIATVSPYLAVRAINGKNYAAANFASGGFVSPPIQPGQGGGPGGGGPPPGGGGPGGGGPGGNARQAAAGDALVIRGIGFGPATPNVPVGQIAPANANVANVSIKVGGKDATVTSVTMVSGAIGAYQIAFTMPDGVAAGEAPIAASVNGIASTQQILLPTR